MQDLLQGENNVPNWASLHVNNINIKEKIKMKIVEKATGATGFISQLSKPAGPGFNFLESVPGDPTHFRFRNIIGSTGLSVLQTPDHIQILGTGGPTGSIGPTGPTGPIGLTGATGLNGATGPTGPNSGFTGPTGPAGTSGWLINGNTGLTGINTLGISGGTDIKLYDNTNSIEITGNTNNQSSLSITSLQLGSTIDTTSSTVTLSNYETGHYIKNTTSFTNVRMPIVDLTPNNQGRVLLCSSNINTTAQGTGCICTSNTGSSDRFLVQGVYSTGVVIRPNMTCLMCEIPSIGVYSTICSNLPASYYKEIFLESTPDNITTPDWFIAMNTVGYIANTPGNTYHGFRCLNNGNFNITPLPPTLRIHTIQITLDTANTVAPDGWTIRVYRENQQFLTAPTLPSTLIYTGSFNTNSTSTTWSLNNTIQSINFCYYIRITNITNGITPRRATVMITGSTPGN